ncbi:MAG TPA: zinc-dependent alcohol dehydrogenase family protein [Pirellulales bacterium]|jgi:propanol-preferring alcohol dehydrogenase|nr:zinc-dependent alcohol dehydrogenase family protein [Pirellulales bacterium]
MKAMLLEQPRQPLRFADVATPTSSPGKLLIRVRACGVCRTDLHVVDGELTQPKFPLVPGHEVVGIVEAIGDGVQGFSVGARVGVPWLGWTCGQCPYCRAGKENLCDNARFTGYQLDGGYADYVLSDARYCFPIPERFSDVEAAPLLCAGLIGYRSLRLAGDGRKLGFYGFGAAGHIVAQVAAFQKREVYAFVRPGDRAGENFARQLGAVWAGPSDQLPPVELDAAIIFAPVGPLVPTALRAVRKGGIVVCAGIHMSDIPSFPYEILWGERMVRSVANLTRQDGVEFMKIAGEIPLRIETQPFPLSSANEALAALRAGKVHGAAVLVVE